LASDGIGGLPELLREAGDLVRIRSDLAFEGPVLPDPDDEVAGVDAGDPGDLVVPEELVEGLSPVHVGGLAAVLADRQGPDVDPVRLVEGVVDAVVPDQREREHENLTLVGGVGEAFLITVHSCCENDLAESVGGVSEGLAFVHCSVLEDQIILCHRE
jgi:hypothetical protein